MFVDIIHRAYYPLHVLQKVASNNILTKKYMKLHNHTAYRLKLHLQHIHNKLARPECYRVIILGGIVGGYNELVTNWESATSINDCILGNNTNNRIGFMFSSKSLTDVPSALSSSNRFWIFVIQSSSYDITQIVWGRASNQPYFRCRQGDDVNPPITWSSWKEL